MDKYRSRGLDRGANLTTRKRESVRTRSARDGKRTVSVREYKMNPVLVLVFNFNFIIILPWFDSFKKFISIFFFFFFFKEKEAHVRYLILNIRQPSIFIHYSLFTSHHSSFIIPRSKQDPFYYFAFIFHFFSFIKKPTISGTI